MLTALGGTWTFFVCVIRVSPDTHPSSDIFLDGYPPVKALDTTRITQWPSLGLSALARAILFGCYANPYVEVLSLGKALLFLPCFLSSLV
jgi:hypothetical protein